MALATTKLTPPAIAFVIEEGNNACSIVEVGFNLKSSLKKHRLSSLVDQQSSDLGSCEVTTRRRSVQWMDMHGKALVDMREFEPSEVSDCEEENLDPLQTCSCSIQ